MFIGVSECRYFSCGITSKRPLRLSCRLNDLIGCSIVRHAYLLICLEFLLDLELSYNYTMMQNVFVLILDLRIILKTLIKEHDRLMKNNHSPNRDLNLAKMVACWYHITQKERFMKKYVNLILLA